MRHLLKLISLFVLSFVLFLSSHVSAKEMIRGYHAIFRPYYDGRGRLRIAIREFGEAKKKLLIIDPATFETSIIDETSVNFKTRPDDRTIRRTSFIKALYRYTAPDKKIQNSGITGAAKGLFLTVDMCPSKKTFDKDLFVSTINANTSKAPVPVAIAVSGLWIERHREDFEWILNEEKLKKLSVTWVNHTYSHPYDEGKPLEENFLLKPGVNFEEEVLKDEIILLKNGITPSPFFRFPGLVSDDKLLEKLRALSLIPIGSNAWLAKDEAPKDGSIILVHGNGNEEEGVKRLKEFYSGKNQLKNIQLLPLRDAFGK